MKSRMSFTAVVPARAGSKRLKGKNMRYLGQRPLLGWTLTAAAAAPSIDQILVSTDSDEATDLASLAGVRVHRRDGALAGDTARNIDVVRALVASGEIATDGIVVLQPTSPFRPAWHIEQCISACTDSRGALSVTLLGSTRSTWLREGAHLRPLSGPNEPDAALLRPSGACYAMPTRTLDRRLELFSATDETVLLEWPFDIDIDTPDDLARAETVLVALPGLQTALAALSPGSLRPYTNSGEVLG